MAKGIRRQINKLSRLIPKRFTNFPSFLHGDALFTSFPISVQRKGKLFKVISKAKFEDGFDLEPDDIPEPVTDKSWLNEVVMLTKKKYGKFKVLKWILVTLFSGKKK
ncbi:MAG: hypothetical protein GY861_28110 [bacterium]|nr:hypothetical protein [bacterium]